MKYPLDKVCVKSGILCPRCQRLVDTGEVQQYEIPIMKTLIELEEGKYKELRQGSYIKAYKSDNIIIVLVQGIGDPKALEKASKDLSQKLGFRVKIIEKTGDIRRLIEQVIHPAILLGVNTLWLPDGSEQVVIRIPRRDHRLISNYIKDYEKILGEIIGKPVRIRYE
ncbi:transcription elongation factor [Desulfurococcaceae archaeon MEX13E-LK6-19]|nr:transcription elongation factor [Desulfurococcaceae archaeon MEX13E-LK6-19]